MSRIAKFALPLIAAGALLASPAHAASHHAAPAGPANPVVTELMARNLPDIPRKDALMLLVDYPPGGADPVHRHDAHAFVYVLEGSIVMQVKGGREVTLTAGQTFYEGPDDIHTVGRNASQTRPARFLVVLIKKQGAPALTPVE
ncbi:cupin domain-containing protein [Achromobacter xylosoxidans]|uniref:cupin domain-containing protein n=1 Tax=Alcaligenes xylosoxydans xylosoxydans TaxID=85698 RepID=UPI00320A2300